MRTTIAILLLSGCSLPVSAADKPRSAATKNLRTLRILLRHADPQTRMQAASALGEMGPRAKSAIPSLMLSLKDRHAMARLYAVRALKSIADKPQDELLECLQEVVEKDSSWLVARQAAIVLEVIHPEHPLADATFKKRPGIGRFTPLLSALLSESRHIHRVHLVRDLFEGDYESTLSAFYELRRRYPANRLAKSFVPLLFHVSQRLRTGAKETISTVGRDGKSAALLAHLARTRDGHKWLPGFIKPLSATGELTQETLACIAGGKAFKKPVRIAALRELVRILGHQRVQALWGEPMKQGLPTPRSRITAMLDVIDPNRKASRSLPRYGDGALRPTIDRLAGKSTAQLLNLLENDEPREVVAAQLLLDARLPSRQLAPTMVPLMFHKASRVRQLARGIVSRVGRDGFEASRYAFRVYASSKPRLPVGAVNSGAISGPLTLRVFDYLYNDRKIALKRRPFGRFDMLLLRGLIRLRKDTPGARRLYARAMLSSNPQAVELARQTLRFTDISQVMFSADWFKRLSETDVSRLLEALTRLRTEGEINDRVAVRVVLLLGHDRGSIADAAHNVLVKRKPKWKRVASSYMELLGSRNGLSRERATASLKKIPAYRKAFIAEIATRLAKEKNADKRRRLLWLAAAIHAKQQAAVDLFAKYATTDRNSAVRETAVIALEGVGKEAGRYRRRILARLLAEPVLTIKLRLVNVLDNMDGKPPAGRKLSKAELEYKRLKRKYQFEVSRRAALEELRQIIAAQKKLQQATEQRNVENVLGKLRAKSK